MRRADSRADWTAGRRRPTSVPMMAITTSNSTNVKARVCRVTAGPTVSIRAPMTILQLEKTK
jgi:hypothetical protein